MELRINRYHCIDNTLGFDPYGTSAWISEYDWNELFGDEKSPLLVRLDCKFPHFAIYSKLNKLKADTDIGRKRGVLTIPYEAINKEFTPDQFSSFSITKIEADKLKIADEICIKLPEKNNTYWSTIEKEKVIESIFNEIEIVFHKQTLFLFPETKSNVLGEITQIFPSQQTENQAYRINTNTKIHFENLRTDEEQVLKLDNIGGLDSLIKELREIIQIPLNHPEYYSRFHINRPKGLLLYGPPGNGKTTIAQALAKSLGMSSFISINITEVWAKYVGQGEKMLRKTFEEAERRGNCVIFIDEIDSIAMIRKKESAGYEVSLVGTLLALMDGLNSGSRVFVIGATNRRDAIDPALRRPGRFDLEKEVPLPRSEARKDILSKVMPIATTEVFAQPVDDKYLTRLAELTNGYSGADLKALYREAALSAIRRSVDFDDDGKEIILHTAEETFIDEKDFDIARRTTTPTSLRGIEMIEDVVSWKDILALDKQKSIFEDLHKKLSYFTKQASIIGRPSFSNILITGKRGTGKRTFVHAFSKEFKYDVIEIDFMLIESMDTAQGYLYIEERFLKAKQIVPSVILIKNIDLIQRPELYINKLFDDISKINRHLNIFVIMACESCLLKDKMMGYKRFTIHVDFDISSETIREAIVSKYGQQVDSIGEKGIGEVLTLLEETKLERKYKQ